MTEISIAGGGITPVFRRGRRIRRLVNVVVTLPPPPTPEEREARKAALELLAEMLDEGGDDGATEAGAGTATP
jgi:hypothetical protein